MSGGARDGFPLIAGTPMARATTSPLRGIHERRGKLLEGPRAHATAPDEERSEKMTFPARKPACACSTPAGPCGTHPSGRASRSAQSGPGGMASAQQRCGPIPRPTQPNVCLEQRTGVRFSVTAEFAPTPQHAHTSCTYSRGPRVVREGYLTVKGATYLNTRFLVPPAHAFLLVPVPFRCRRPTQVPLLKKKFSPSLYTVLPL